MIYEGMALHELSKEQLIELVNALYTLLQRPAPAPAYTFIPNPYQPVNVPFVPSMNIPGLGTWPTNGNAVCANNQGEQNK